MKYAWIKEHRDSFPVTALCRVLQVSPSGYLRFDRSDAEPKGSASRADSAIDSASPCRIARHLWQAKITDQLQSREELESACRNTVATAMRELGLKSKVSKAFMPTTTKSDPTKRPAENLLDRDFTAEAPNRKWVTDITYLATAAGWVYLAVVLDLFGRKVVGWSIGTSLATDLVSDALRQAIENRRPDGKQLLHHSDRGCQYTSDAYQATLKALGIECSMSRTGNCYDNAVMERFFWSFKHEWTKHESFETLDDAQWSVFKYIETFYNRVRIHQALGYKTPDQYEAEHAPVLAA